MAIWKPAHTAAELAAELKAVKAEYELKFLQLEQRFTERLRELEGEIEQMEIALIERIDHAEKIARVGSLDNERKSNETPADMLPGKGYKTWSQRKAERVVKKSDPQFAEKIRRRSGNGRSNAANQAGSSQAGNPGTGAATVAE